MKCSICPRKCNVDRTKTYGFCEASEDLKIARASIHMWEEPCISGSNGSGTIFFSHCNMKCIFCQNYDISTKNIGYKVSVSRFAEICLELQSLGANNINLVTPTHYVDKIIEGIKFAKEKGLKIPIVYNTSGYENVDTIKKLDGIVDIYLPDLKYYSDEYAIKYSRSPKYFEYATKAIEEMYKQVGKNIFNEDGMMTKGVLVRHLMLPGLANDSKKIIKYLYDTYKDNIYISIMNQYTPIRKLEYDNLNRKITKEEYENMIDYAYDLGIRNCFVQDEETQSESFIPIFDGRGVLKGK